MVTGRIGNGWRYQRERERLVWKKEYEEEDKREGLKSDKKTALEYAKIANDMEPDLRMTVDYPSNHQDGRMPVLDMKIWMERTEGNTNRMKHTFYEKPMTPMVTVRRDAALSWIVKKSALAGEVARRLLNCSRDLVWEEGLEHVEKFNYKMMLSGYQEGERNVIVREGMARYRNLRQEELDGKRPLYRSHVWKRERRCVNKKMKLKNWYGKFDSVIFVQATPGEELKKRLTEEAKRCRISVKIVEQSGRSIKSILQRSDPAGRKECGDEKCVICGTKGEGRCRKESVGYKVWCKECEEKRDKVIMHGETGRCAKVRCGEHAEALKRGDWDSRLWEHCKEVHKGERVEFGYKVVRSFENDVLGRQLDEALRIEKEEGKLLNNKREWVRPAGVRFNVERM